jgi:hypothetical protein
MSASADPNGLAELRMLGDDVPETDETARARARSRLDRAIEREQAASARATRWRWGAVAAAIVAVSVATSIILRGTADRPSAGSALMELATVASIQAPPSVPAGSYVYTRARTRTTVTTPESTTGETETEIVTTQRETWIASDGSGLVLERPIQPGSGEIHRVLAEPGTLRFTSLDQVPTEPRALLDAIMGHGFLDEPDDDFEVLSGIGALLRDSYVDSAHRESLFLIVGGIEGVEVEENYRDPLGRLGTALSLRNGARSVTLVFEARTSRLLADSETHPDGIASEATYLQTAVVGAAGERPADSGT